MIDDTTDHAAAIRELVDESEGMTLYPSDADAIRAHLDALAAQLSEANRDRDAWRDDGHEAIKNLHRQIRVLDCKLAETEARAARLRTALEHQVNIDRKRRTLVKITREQIVEYCRLHPGDLDDLDPQGGS